MHEERLEMVYMAGAAENKKRLSVSDAADLSVQSDV